MSQAASGEVEALTGHDHHRYRLTAARRMAPLVNNRHTTEALDKCSFDVESDCPAQHASGTEQPAPPLSRRSSYHKPQNVRQDDDICGLMTKVYIT